MIEERTIRFNITYYTHPGENIVVTGNDVHLGALVGCRHLDWKGDGLWQGIVTATGLPDVLKYKYGVKKENHVDWETGKYRTIHLEDYAGSIDCFDEWKSDQTPEEGFLYSSLFSKVLFPSKAEQTAPHPRATSPPGMTLLEFRLPSCSIESDQQLYVSGSLVGLGSWDSDRAVRFEHSRGALIATVLVGEEFPLEFKYFVKQEDGAVRWENGMNRRIDGALAQSVIYTSTLRRTEFNWRGAGVAVPVFSLRSKTSMGVGEFKDLFLLVDLCKRTGMHLIQILPINDTAASGTWRDSYPYSSLSVFALHLLYLHLPDITSDVELVQEIVAVSEDLNRSPVLDYEAVMKMKTHFTKVIFEKEGDESLSTDSFLLFFETSKEWLVPYSLFKVLSEIHGTTDFHLWKDEYQNLTKDAIEELSLAYKRECEYHYFIQYHLHCQLLEVSQYAVSNRVGFKGDLPIGVNLNSVECWLNPTLFNLNMSTGAPPDQFSADGQNWGFPTYNWEEMKRTNYTWWKSRLRQMSIYFHAFRIDHILGFFRIWEIPRDFNSGLMGHFYPSIPIHRNELEALGIWDIDRLTYPYITHADLQGFFGSHTNLVINTYFSILPSGNYAFKLPFNTETKLIAMEPLLQEVDFALLKSVFLTMIKDVILIPRAEDPSQFYPRINFNKTKSYDALPRDDWKRSLWELYIHYYYVRQEGLWESIGYERLPMIKAASDMLVCGEDLGMLPGCIFPVMKKSMILSLKIQRMPPDPTHTFAHPSTYPYLSVCTTSTHDCSNLREWWEEDNDKTKHFWKHLLGGGAGTHWGYREDPPLACEPWLVRKIVEQHLWSPSMWTIFPIQDLFGLRPDLCVEDPKSERINEPSNPQHYWRYRIQVTLESLNQNDEFIKELYGLISASGQRSIYRSLPIPTTFLPL